MPQNCVNLPINHTICDFPVSLSLVIRKILSSTSKFFSIQFRKMFAPRRYYSPFELLQLSMPASVEIQART